MIFRWLLVLLFWLLWRRILIFLLLIFLLFVVMLFCWLFLSWGELFFWLILLWRGLIFRMLIWWWVCRFCWWMWGWVWLIFWGWLGLRILRSRFRFKEWSFSGGVCCGLERGGGEGWNCIWWDIFIVNERIMMGSVLY